MTTMRVAISETMTLPAGGAKLWFAVDELDALGANDGLNDAPARLALRDRVIAVAYCRSPAYVTRTQQFLMLSTVSHCSHR